MIAVVVAVAVAVGGVDVWRRRGRKRGWRKRKRKGSTSERRAEIRRRDQASVLPEDEEKMG